MNLNRSLVFAAASVILLASWPVSAKPGGASRPARRAAARRVAVLQWPRLSSQIPKNQSDYQAAAFTAKVTALQYLLRRQGFYKSKPDGQFGPQTLRAVKSFQRSRGLVADGVAGPQTWPKLIVRVHRGSRGDTVRAVQVLLRDQTSHDGGEAYPTLHTDGVFGAETQEAVKITQDEHNTPAAFTLTSDTGDFPLATNGVVGPETWCILFYGKVNPVRRTSAIR